MNDAEFLELEERIIVDLASYRDECEKRGFKFESSVQDLIERSGE